MNQIENELMALRNAVATLAARSAPAEQGYAPNSNTPFIEPGPRDWYSYQTGRLEYDAAQTRTGTIPIEADSNFYMNAISYQADVSAAALTEATNIIPLITILITDTGSSRQLMSAPVPLAAITGDGKRPYRLPKPRLFMRTSSIAYSLTSYGVTDNVFVNVIFHGFKVYNLGR